MLTTWCCTISTRHSDWPMRTSCSHPETKAPPEGRSLPSPQQPRARFNAYQGVVLVQQHQQIPSTRLHNPRLNRKYAAAATRSMTQLYAAATTSLQQSCQLCSRQVQRLCAVIITRVCHIMPTNASTAHWPPTTPSTPILGCPSGSYVGPLISATCLIIRALLAQASRAHVSHLCLAHSLIPCVAP